MSVSIFITICVLYPRTHIKKKNKNRENQIVNMRMISPGGVIQKNEVRGQKGNVAKKITEVIDDWVLKVQNQNVGAMHEALDAVKNDISDYFK